MLQDCRAPVVVAKVKLGGRARLSDSKWVFVDRTPLPRVSAGGMLFSMACYVSLDLWHWPPYERVPGVTGRSAIPKQSSLTHRAVGTRASHWTGTTDILLEASSAQLA